MQAYAKNFLAHLDEQGIKYSETDKENVYKIAYSGENLDTITIYAFFDEEGDPYVQLRCWNIANFNKKKEVGFEICNELNMAYRWVKFYIDKDNDVIAMVDAIVDLDTCGAECLQLVRRSVQIIDEAFPKIAKARWA